MAPTCFFRLQDDTWGAWECRFCLWFTARSTACTRAEAPQLRAYEELA